MGERLKDKVAIITGGSRGIGCAIARAFAAEGARVVIASRKQDALDEAAARITEAVGGTVAARACHTGDPDAVKQLVAWTEAELGLPTILVNNAATNPYFGPLLGTPEAAWDKTFDVNLKGYFEASRQVAKRLVAAGTGGSIVNVASILGMGAAPFQGVYGMTKAAVISMTKTMAFELGAAKIRVNAVAPGLVDTRFASALTANPQLVKHFNDRTALGRFAQPEEIVGGVVYLASDEASFVTGTVLAIDGGYVSS